VLALEEKDIFMRVINVPGMSDKELRSSITFEAEQYIPLPLEEVNLSYQKLEIPTSQKGKISVQLVAAKKDVIERYIKIVKEAKLIPVGVEPEALAIGRALTSKNDGEANLILHMGFQKSLIIITLKNSVVFTRTLSSGGDAMSRAIAQNLNLDYMQAEEYKKAYGLNQDQADGKIYEALKPMFESIISEIGRAQMFFTTHHPGVNINRVVLSGGTALMPGLLLFMANNLNVEVELANPFANMNFSKDIANKKDWHIQNGPLFAVPLGLALKEF
jgi:type IV pilus assembly protein PilM